jgi:hypothetical protein
MKNSAVAMSTTPPACPPDVLVRSPAEIDSYLKDYPELRDVLSAMCRSAREEFGSVAELNLDVYHDPEIDDHYLSLIVRLPAYDQATTKRIDVVWGQSEDDISKSAGWLTLTSDYRLLKGHNGV